ncbi:MAG: hypothetical protein JRF33_00495 [Deltaproteobacteria bacterium]|nr:hypothetical protein [Deltaproteobacteria bacterium]
MKNAALVALTLAMFSLLPSCGETLNLPSQEDIDWAGDMVGLAADVAEQGKTALEMLGLLPTYECEEPRGTFVGDIIADFEIEHACATISTQAQGEEADLVTITFPAGGCEIHDTTLAGTITFMYSGGTDRMDLEADFSQLQIDGILLGSSAGYGTCGDESHYWARGAGEIPGTEQAYSMDLTVGLRAGIPIIGGSTILLDGSAQLLSEAGDDSITFENLEYEGGLLPKEGTLIIQTASGHTIRAEFSSSFLFGEAKITIDDYNSVSVPIP